MKNAIAAAIFFSAMLASINVIGYTRQPRVDNVLPYREGSLLVRIDSENPDDSLTAIAGEIGAEAVEAYTLVPGLWRYEFDSNVDIEDAIALFESSDRVLYVEPDYIYSAAVNDPQFANQWALENVGQTGGLTDADINANSMWAIEDGDPSIVVGVIDTGIDYNHTDLIPNLWRNTREIAGNGVDDDLNGYVDDVVGINAITNSGNPLDDNAHGTHVSGTIGAAANNSVGIAGVAQQVKIAACKFLAANGSGATSDAIKCLQYFAALKTRALNPVNIVATSNSWGGTSKSTALQDAIRAHQNLGVLFIAAAGNETTNTDVTQFYPANYELSNIITVAATDSADRLASFSNYGRRSVHVGAPGVRILSTVLNQSYAYFSGTSMATPHVSGLVAITKAKFPTLDFKQIKNLVIASGTPISALQNTTISGRRIRGADINGRGALTCSNQVVASRLKPTASSVSITKGQSIFLSALRINCSQPLSPLVLYSNGVENVILQDAGTNGDALANDGIASVNWQPQNTGSYALNFGNGDIVTVIVSQAPPAYKAFAATYSYETITGTSLGAGDETIHTVTVPFPIHFSNNATGYQTMYVSPNGTISFTTTTNPGYTNTNLPTSQASTLVAPFWDDLIPYLTNSNVFVATTGTAPNRRFVVEWRNMRQYNTSGTGTFQAIFYESSSDIRFNYLDTSFGNANYDAGRSATVGVQSSSTVAFTYSYNLPNIPSQSSLLFRVQ